MGKQITCCEQTALLTVSRVEAVAEAVFQESESGGRAQDEEIHSRVLEATVNQAPRSMPSPSAAFVVGRYMSQQAPQGSAVVVLRRFQVKASK